MDIPCKTRIFLISSFLFLSGWQILPAESRPALQSALIGSYPDCLPPIPPGKKVVLVGGVFDLIHYGHLNFLKAAKSQGDYLIVSIEPDFFIKQRKHRQPVHTQQQRAELLSHMDMVDQVIMLPSMQGYEDYLNLVQTLHPQVIAITEGEPHRTEKERQATQVGAKVIPVIGRNSTFSTRQILKHTCK